jgi:serine/threonine protein kinase
MYPTYAKFNKHGSPKQLLNYREIFTTVKLLGEGNFGETYLITDKKSNKKYALKVMPPNEDYNREVSTLISLSKPSCDKDIVCYYDSFTFKLNNKLYYAILTEYIDGKTLREYDEIYTLSYNNILTIGMWLLKTIDKLHKKGIVHNDISIDNIMVTKEGKLKLIDFGLSCNVYAQRENKCVGNRKANMNYVAPELISGKIFSDPKKYSKTADIFSIGVLLYELLTFRKPYNYNEDYVIISKYIHIRGEPCLDNTLHHMLYINPDTRATATQAYNLWSKCN